MLLTAEPLLHRMLRQPLREIFGDGPQVLHKDPSTSTVKAVKMRASFVQPRASAMSSVMSAGDYSSVLKFRSAASSDEEKITRLPRVMAWADKSRWVSCWL